MNKRVSANLRIHSKRVIFCIVESIGFKLNNSDGKEELDDMELNNESAKGKIEQIDKSL